MKHSNKLLAVPLTFAVLLSLAFYSLPGCNSGPAEIARLTILVTGDVEGYLKNCGCSGGQIGGELRKARVVRNEHEAAVRPLPGDKGDPAEVLLLDTGNFVEGRDLISELYSQGVVASMSTLDYDSVGLGLQELMYSDRNERGKVQQKLWELLGDKGLPLTAANLTFIPPENGEDYSSQLNGLIEPLRIIRLPGGFRVGVVHLVDTRLLEAERRRIGVELKDMVATAREVYREHKPEADFWILTVGGAEMYKQPPAEIARLTEFTLVIGYDHPNPLEGDSSEVLFPYFINRPFSKAKSVVNSTVHFADDGHLRITSTQMALNTNVGTDEQVEQIILELQPRLEDLELDQTTERLKTTGPKPWYEGKDTCRACHTEIYDFMEETRHAHAWQSLVDGGKQRNSDCLPCHVTGHGTNIGGWNIVNNNTPEFQNVTCESCHGPGEYHTTRMAALLSGAEYEEPEDLRAGGRNELGIVNPDQKDCRVCHDALNSVNFSFDTYWPKIDHSAGGIAEARRLRAAELAGQAEAGHNELDDHAGHMH